MGGYRGCRCRRTRLVTAAQFAAAQVARFVSQCDEGISTCGEGWLTANNGQLWSALRHVLPGMRILYPAQKAIVQLKKIGLGLALDKTTITEFLPRLKGTDFDFTARNSTRADPDVLRTSNSPTAGGNQLELPAGAADPQQAGRRGLRLVAQA
jgi:hypothetical protein